MPGTSGLALLPADDEWGPVMEALRPLGGTLVRASPSAEQESELARELGGPA